MKYLPSLGHFRAVTENKTIYILSINGHYTAEWISPFKVGHHRRHMLYSGQAGTAQCISGSLLLRADTDPVPRPAYRCMHGTHSHTSVAIVYSLGLKSDETMLSHLKTKRFRPAEVTWPLKQVTKIILVSPDLSSHPPQKWNHSF